MGNNEGKVVRFYTVAQQGAYRRGPSPPPSPVPPSHDQGVGQGAKSQCPPPTMVTWKQLPKVPPLQHSGSGRYLSTVSNRLLPWNGWFNCSVPQFPYPEKWE